MDAYAYLIRHGWSGPGNPLNPDRAGVRGGLGLTKPLLVARRSGNQGVGNKTTKDPTNQWWLRGFEDALKGIGTPKEETIIGKGNALTSELYRHFVRGEVVPGTIGKKEEEDGKERSKKRKRGNDEQGESKDAKKLRKEEKRRRKKRERKEQRAVEKAEKRERKAKEKEEKKINKHKREAEKKEKEKKPEDDYPTPVSMDSYAMDTQDGPSSLDTEKLKKKEKGGKKEKKKEKEGKKDRKRESSSDESSKRKSKKSKTIR
ncbi:hypothetical protein BDW71DRAFT_133602 [Aspergillus fruticulosus]